MGLTNSFYALVSGHDFTGRIASPSGAIEQPATSVAGYNGKHLSVPSYQAAAHPNDVVEVGEGGELGAELRHGRPWPQFAVRPPQNRQEPGMHSDQDISQRPALSQSARIQGRIVDSETRLIIQIPLWKRFFPTQVARAE